MLRMWRVAAALMLAGWSAIAPAAWQEASSRHFRVYSDDTPEAVSAFATRLERFDKAMRVLRGMEDPPFSPTQRVTVYVLRDVGAVQKLLGKRDVAGVYMPRVSGAVAFVPRNTREAGRFALSAQAVLLHEYAHHFMFASWGERAFPAWYVEGFAEFNATVVFDDDRLIVGPPPLYRAQGLIDKEMVPMRTLLTGTPQDDGMPGARTQVFYGRAWLLTHYLTLDSSRRPLLSGYLDALQSGTSLKDAARLLGDPNKLDNALNAYSRTRLPLLALKVADLPIEPVVVRALGPGAEAIMPVVLRSARGVNARTAPDVALAARTAAAAWPNDPFVQGALAEAEFDAKQFDAAEAAAARALATAPGSRQALIYRGLAQAAIAHRDHADGARWKDVRQWFVKANRADPEDPWPLVAFYQALVAAGEPMTPNAEKGLSYAYTLAPFDRGLALQVAAMHLRQKRWAEAVPALRRVAYDPHGGKIAGVAATLLTAIDARQTTILEQATDILDGKDPEANDGD